MTATEERRRWREADRPFLNAIRAAPEDDAPKAIYADWLAETDRRHRLWYLLDLWYVRIKPKAIAAWSDPNHPGYVIEDAAAEVREFEPQYEMSDPSRHPFGPWWRLTLLMLTSLAKPMTSHHRWPWGKKLVALRSRIEIRLASHRGSWDKKLVALRSQLEMRWIGLTNRRAVDSWNTMQASTLVLSSPDRESQSIAQAVRRSMATRESRAFIYAIRELSLDYPSLRNFSRVVGVVRDQLVQEEKRLREEEDEEDLRRRAETAAE